MSCNCDNGPDYYLQCAGVMPVYTEAQVTNYAVRVGATGGTKNWVQCYAIACLRGLRLIYWANNPGDCGQPTGVAPNVNQIIGGKLQQVAAVDPEPISAGIAAIVGKITSLFGAAHAKAVLNEHKFLCSAMMQYNQFADAMEQAVAQGAISVPDAVSQMQSVCTQIRSGLSPVVKPINAGYGMQLALDALKLMNAEVIYPALKPSPVTGFINGLLGTGPSPANGPASAASTPPDGVFNTAGGKVFLVGAGIVGAKILGVI